MGLADKAIAGAIRGVAKAVGSAEKKAAGYVGSKVLAHRADPSSAYYTINAFLGKFTDATETEIVKHQGVSSIVPRSYMFPMDLKHVKTPKGERVYLGGNDITDHWNSGNFKAEHLGEYLPDGPTRVEYGPWYKGDWGSMFGPNNFGKGPTLKTRYRAWKGNRDMQYFERPYDFTPDEIQMGREWIAGTGASTAAFWGAVSQMRKPNPQRTQVKQAIDEEQGDEEQGR